MPEHVAEQHADDDGHGERGDVAHVATFLSHGEAQGAHVPADGSDMTVVIVPLPHSSQAS